MKIIAIAGSLREESSTAALLRALAALAPDRAELRPYDGIGDLPFFSPERDLDPAPPTVARLRAALSDADAAVICTPEYAHGMPGVLKNALDWIVGSGELSRKPVAALSASPAEDGGSHAHASLVEVLTTMDARVIPDASLVIGFVRAKLGSGESGNRIADDQLRESLTAALLALREAARPPDATVR